MKFAKSLVALVFILVSMPALAGVSAQAYLDNSGRDDVLSGGVRMIPVTTPKGTFHVWTKRTGNNPDIKVLILHGGPGITHEAYEAFDSYFPGAHIEYYYYDQLGSYYSDQPHDPSLWSLPRFVDEVEQVRRALHLDKDNFYLYGQSWGGLLAIEYALKYQTHLKGLIVSNMMSSIPAYNRHVDALLTRQLDPKVLTRVRHYEAAGEFDNPEYQQLLMTQIYPRYVLRMPLDQWPDPVTRAFAHGNDDLNVAMQGPSELRVGGKLEHWDRSDDLHTIKVPTLVIGARYDTMDPKYLKWMAEQLPHGRYLYCPDGSHMAMYDDQATYMHGLIRFIEDVDHGKSP